MQETRQHQGRLRRRGVTSVEILVAFMLLSTALAFATPLVVRNGRLLSEQQEYRLALDEVSNQLERLAALGPEQIPDAIKNLAPSPATAARLPAVRLVGQLSPDDRGHRLTVSLSWEESQRYRAPVSLTTWTYPRRDESDREARDGEAS